MNVYYLNSKRALGIICLALLAAAFLAYPAIAEEKPAKAEKETAAETAPQEEPAEADASEEEAPEAAPVPLQKVERIEIRPSRNSKPEQEPKAEAKAAAKEEAKKEEPAETEKETAETAEEKTEAPAPEAEEEVKEGKEVKADYAALESLGLYKTEKEGSLGPNIWEGSKRSEIVFLLKNIPADNRSAALTSITKRLLLTPADMKQIENDVEIRPGQDLLTLRLEKLLDMGAYREAADLYALVKEDPYHERLGRVGVLALLLGGEKSLACLEGHTLQGQFAQDEFWKDFLAYCAVSIEENPPAGAMETLRASSQRVLANIADNAEFKFTYEPKAFGRLSELERAALIADGRLDAGNIDKLIKDGTPARDIRALLQSKNISDKDRLRLTAELVERGLAPVAELTALYKAYAKPAAGDATTVTETKKAGSWEALPQLYNQTIAATDNNEKWKLVSQAFAMQQEFGIGALTPFSDFIPGLKPETVSLREINTVLKTMNVAGQTLPDYWDKSLAQFQVTPQEKDLYFQTVIANYASKQAFQQSAEERKKIEVLAQDQNPLRATFAKIIIENLDKAGKDINNAAEIYEKDFGLTLTEDYVMPSVTVWDRIKVSSHERRLGETILLSATALRGPQPYYPGLLRDVLGSFENVGLTNISGRLAAEALLGK